MPPYTDEDQYKDEDEEGIDEHNQMEKTSEFIKGRKPAKCLGLALSDSHNLGPYQAGVIKGLAHSLPTGSHY